MQMPGRKPSIVRKLFSPEASSGKTKKMACHFCKTAVADNGKRMADHTTVCKIKNYQHLYTSVAYDVTDMNCIISSKDDSLSGHKMQSTVTCEP